MSDQNETDCDVSDVDNDNTSVYESFDVDTDNFS